jgi:hypothetical protein
MVRAEKGGLLHSLGQMRDLLQLPSFHIKSQILEIYKHTKHFKDSHKVEVLARIYFNIKK